MKTLKVLFSGLANAGKTSILKILDNSFEKIPEITPTIGVERSSYKVAGIDASIWDLGGQTGYRKKYLEEYERYFGEASVVFYIIDIQDDQSTKSTISYLQNVVEIFEKLRIAEVHFAVLFHKFDPHLRSRDNSQVGKRAETLHKQINGILKKFPHAFYETTIYQQAGIFKAFSETLLSKMSWREILQHKVQEFAEELRSPAVMLLSNKGYVYASWHALNAQITDLVKFTQQIQDFANTVSERTPPGFTRIVVTEMLDCAILLLPTMTEMLIFAQIIPKMAKSEEMRAALLKKEVDLRKVLQIVAA